MFTGGQNARWYVPVFSIATTSFPFPREHAEKSSNSESKVERTIGVLII